MIRFPYEFFFKFLIVLFVLFCVLNVSIDKGFTRLVTQNGELSLESPSLLARIW